MSELLPFLTAGNVATALVILNGIAFIAFGLDKLKAEAGERRVAESTLLMWALVGGTVGAYAARATFRHKTRKQPFSSQLHTIAVLQALALTVLAGSLIMQYHDRAPAGGLASIAASVGAKRKLAWCRGVGVASRHNNSHQL